RRRRRHGDGPAAAALAVRPARRQPCGHLIGVGERRVSAVVLVSRVGSARGARAAAAAPACAGSEAGSAGLLADRDGGRPPRPALVATAAARELEERLGAHLPDAGVASRGRICHLTLEAGEGALERAAKALAVRHPGAAAAVHLPPERVQAAL